MSILSTPIDFVRPVRVLVAVWIGVIGGLLAVPSPLPAAAAGAAKRSFDIPAGDVVNALKVFSAQSGAQVIYPEEQIEGAKTNALKGAFTSVDAIDRLLAGTNLKAAYDQISGSFAVSRAPVSRKDPAPPND
jgi:iron complex outermembrane receptor protein